MYVLSGELFLRSGEGYFGFLFLLQSNEENRYQHNNRVST